MAFLVYSDDDYDQHPQGLVIHERTEKAAVREFVRRVRGKTALPAAGEWFNVTPLGKPHYVTIQKPKAEFELVDYE